MNRRRLAVYVAVLLGLGSDTAPASEGQAKGHNHGGHDLGKVEFPVTGSKEAQAEFTRAVSFLHHMTYPQARTAFEKAAQIDPKCAMAHWGIAITLFQPLWPTRPSPEALQRGWQEVQKAKEVQSVTEREKLFIACAEAFFREPASRYYWLRIRRWEEASAKMYAAFPDDPEVMAVYALAHLATAPANKISREHSDRAAEILLRVYRRNPDHPGAMHYLVHANDVPGRERESLEITRKYEEIAPHNPHALHMPTHIYTRLGDWDAVVRGNLRAAAAALDYPAGEKGEFVWDEFPHAIEYLVYAYLQQGADEEALGQIKRLRETPRVEPTFKTAFHLASTQARYALERRAWEEAASLVLPKEANVNWDRFPWPEAIVHFARGLGAAHVGKLDQAETARARLGELEQTMRDAKEDLFARNIAVARLALSAWIAHVGGDKEGSLALMNEAVELETSTPKHAVTPGPTLPASELLGDLLLEQNRPADALAAYERTIKLYPRRFNNLLNAARAAHRAGKEAMARTHYQDLLRLANRSTRAPELEEARKYLESKSEP